jgi:hypothetical protein
MDRLEEISAQLEKLQASLGKKRDPRGWFKDV